MDKDLYQMVEILGRDDPQVKALLWAANDPAMAENVHRSTPIRNSIDHVFIAPFLVMFVGC